MTTEPVDAAALATLRAALVAYEAAKTTRKAADPDSIEYYEAWVAGQHALNDVILAAGAVAGAVAE